VKVGFLVLLAIYDAKVGLFLTPHFARSAAEGIRMFADEIGREGSQLQQHPEDFSLHRLGELEQPTGVVVPDVAPTMLCTGIELVAREGLKVAQ